MTCFSMHGKAFLTVKAAKKKKKCSGSRVACGLLLHGFFLLLLASQASPVTLREARAGPQVQRVHEAYFR